MAKLKTTSSLVVLGDSIAFGEWDSEGGWVRRIQKREAEKIASGGTGAFVYNLSIPGETVLGTKARLAEVDPRLEEEAGNCVVFALGTNDSKVFRESGKTKIEMQLYIDTLKEIAQNFLNQNCTVVFVGLFSVDEGLVNNEYKKYIFSNKNIREYDRAMRNVAGELGVVYIGFEDVLHEVTLHTDGVHLTDDAHAYVAERVYESLQDNHIL